MKIYNNKYILSAFSTGWVSPTATGFSLGSNFNINNKIYYTTGYTNEDNIDHNNRCLLVELNGKDKKIYAYSMFSTKSSLRVLFCGCWKMY